MKRPSARVVLGYGVWVFSFFAALILTLLIVYVGLGTDIQTYSVKYFVVTVIPIAMIFVIWLDYLLDTKMLPD
jgi:hypothetical protein